MYTYNDSLKFRGFAFNPDRVRPPHLIAIGVSALALTLSASSASAQGADRAPTGVNELPEIIVQARKRDEVLNKIPESISVVSAAQIQKAGVKGLDDIGRLTPNVRLNRKQDNEPNVVIRGVGSFGNTQGVGFYIDDVQNFTDQTTSVEDVQRIEILKGPQGTLYGGSNVGGAIKYVMVKPSDKFGVQARAEYGSFDTANLFGALNMPMGETLATRVSGYYNRSDGFVRNVVIGGRSDRSEEWGVRGAVRWTPLDDLTVDLSYRHNELRRSLNVFLPYDNVHYSREAVFNEQGYGKRIVDGAILTAKYGAGIADITSVTSYTRRKASFLVDADYSPADGLVTYTPYPNKTKVFTQELRLSSIGDGPITWLVGAYYAHIDDLSPTSHINFLLGTDFGGPLLLPDFYNTTSEFQQKALFGTVGYRTGPFKIEGGVRLGRSEFEVTYLNDPVASAQSNGTKVLPKLTLSYDLNTNTILYGNIGVGSEPGKANITLSRVPYKAETATSVEFGMKGSAFDRRLSYNVAAFYIDYKDRQLETQVLDTDGIVKEGTSNIGKSRGYGIEAGFSYRATSELTVSASGGYLYSKWRDKNAFYDNGSGPQSVDGLQIPNAPKFSGNATVDYTRDLGGNLSLGLRADVSHTGSLYWDVLNTGKAKSYTLVNLRASLGRSDSGWEFAIRGDNVFNKKYYNEVLPNIFGPDASLGTPGRPATVMASISLKY